MSYKTILVHADADPTAEARVRLAAGLARHHDACLIGAAARLPAPLLEVYAAGTAVVSAGLVDVATEETETAFKTAESLFHGWVMGYGLGTEWRAVVDFPTVAIAGMAATADLVVVGRADRSEPHGSQYLDPGELIMKAGRPVLVVPPGCDALNAENILVAWKNTREARRALADALPFLKEAKQVTLLHVTEADGGTAGLADTVAFLARHGIKASPDTVSPEHQAVGERIVAAARQKRSGLIVAGAYGHTRIREWAFGGVTRDLLAANPVPCLFSR